jgi:hypothetical protein
MCDPSKLSYLKVSITSPIYYTPFIYVAQFENEFCRWAKVVLNVVNMSEMHRI